MTAYPAFARVPVAGRQIVQDLHQVVLAQQLRKLRLVEVVREQVFDALESSLGCGAETIEKAHFVEEHRKIGG